MLLDFIDLIFNILSRNSFFWVNAHNGIGLMNKLKLHHISKYTSETDITGKALWHYFHPKAKKLYPEHFITCSEKRY